MLYEIKESNASLARRLDRVEQAPTKDVTPLNHWSHMHNFPSHSSQMGSPQLLTSNADQGGQIRDPLHLLDQRQDQAQLFNPPPQLRVHEPQQCTQEPQIASAALPQTKQPPTFQVDRHDAVIPNLQTLRSNATVSDAVNNLLSSYEGQIHTDIQQGKQQSGKRSGRYNTHNTVSTQPHLRWPNEGFHASNGKKRLTYDELSIPQWIAGQLTNIYAMSDPTLVKQAKLQMTLAMRDTASLPWAAVKLAWASSMHEVEEGSLTWGNSTQWAINRLSASQIALAQPQAGATSSPCKYYNKATCSHEGHHGSYSHICSHCYKQGKQFTHPETKCNAKQRQNSKIHQSNS